MFPKLVAWTGSALAPIRPGVPIAVPEPADVGGRVRTPVDGGPRSGRHGGCPRTSTDKPLFPLNLWVRGSSPWRRTKIACSTGTSRHLIGPPRHWTPRLPHGFDPCRRRSMFLDGARQRIRRGHRHRFCDPRCPLGDRGSTSRYRPRRGQRVALCRRPDCPVPDACDGLRAWGGGDGEPQLWTWPWVRSRGVSLSSWIRPMVGTICVSTSLRWVRNVAGRVPSPRLISSHSPRRACASPYPGPQG